LLDAGDEALVEFGPRTLLSGRGAALRRLLALPAAAKARYVELYAASAEAALRAVTTRHDAGAAIALATRFPLAPVAADALRLAAALAAEAGDGVTLDRAIGLLVLRGEARADDFARAVAMLAARGGPRAGIAIERLLATAQQQAAEPVSGAAANGATLAEFAATALADLVAGEAATAALGRAPLEVRKLGLKSLAERYLADTAEQERVIDWRRDLTAQLLAVPPSYAAPSDFDASGEPRSVLATGRLGLYAIDPAAPVKGSLAPTLEFAALLGLGADTPALSDRSLEPCIDDGIAYLAFTRSVRGGARSDERSRLLAVELDPLALRYLVSDFGVTATGEDLTGYVLEGPPVRFGDTLLISGSRLASQTECGLFAFDAATGALRWFRFLCSGTHVGDRYDERNQPVDPRRARPAPVVVRDGVAYVVTNLGIVAAVNATRGAIDWLFRYNRLSLVDTETYAPAAFFDTGGFDPAPPAVLEDALLVTPEDSRFCYLLAREPGPGGELILADPWFKSDLCGLLAVAERRRETLWQAREVIGPNRDAMYLVAIGFDGARLWRTRAFEFEEQLAGRAVVVDSVLIVPTTKRLLRLDLERGGLQADQVLPPADAGEAAFFGNLAIAGDRLYSASDSHVVELRPRR
jgi:hypothetical protein